MGDTFSLSAAGIRVVLLDIEGTTTPIAFVHEVLFPYARARVRPYLEGTAAADPEIQQILAGLRQERSGSGFQNPDSVEPPLESRQPQAADIVPYVHWLMDRDRKSGPLKALQGRIWQEGYASGALRGEVYPDVLPAFARWTSAGVRIGIFSSGSVLAQRLLFELSTAGDLSRFLTSHFDTGVGAKADAGSYRRIIAALDVRPTHVLFVSDVVAELDAAREGGLRTLLCVRPPPPAPAPGAHGIIEHFGFIVA